MSARMDTHMKDPLISVCIPTHGMEDHDYFLNRATESVYKQTYKNYEIVLTTEGKMAENTNAAIKKATGDIVKILYMDDFLYSEDALLHIAETFQGGAKWAASSCLHTEDGETFYNMHLPWWSDGIVDGSNTIGSPSVVAFVNDSPTLFDEKLSWLLDCDLYHRLHRRYGEPVIIETADVAIGIGPHQMTNLLPLKNKLDEHLYLKDKYA